MLNLLIIKLLPMYFTPTKSWVSYDVDVRAKEIKRMHEQIKEHIKEAKVTK